MKETVQMIGLAAVLGVTGMLAAGCAERPVAYVPTYQAPPGYPPSAMYGYQSQTVYQALPGTVPPRPGLVTTNPAPVTVEPQSAPAQPPNVVVQAQTPPPPQVEVVPVAPGPGYAWVPGYWAWNGGWVWVGGVWAVRPHPHAVWIGPHWVRRGRGYIWVHGHWR